MDVLCCEKVGMSRQTEPNVMFVSPGNKADEHGKKIPPEKHGKTSSTLPSPVIAQPLQHEQMPAARRAAARLLVPIAPVGPSVVRPVRVGIHQSHRVGSHRIASHRVVPCGVGRGLVGEANTTAVRGDCLCTAGKHVVVSGLQFIISYIPCFGMDFMQYCRFCRFCRFCRLATCETNRLATGRGGIRKTVSLGELNSSFLALPRLALRADDRGA